jgi:hypothetical protein
MRNGCRVIVAEVEEFGFGGLKGVLEIVVGDIGFVEAFGEDDMFAVISSNNHNNLKINYSCN